MLPLENVIVADAGCILAEVQAAAEAAGRLFPLSLGSQGSARIGGLLSTNAGGVNVLRYGNARELALGIEAVLPDGSVMHTLRRLRKDNAGYDIRNLLIGAEGTLGIITAAALRLFPRPARMGAALLVVPGPAAAIELLAMARDRIGDGLSAFELIAQQGFHFLTETGLGPRQPFAEPPEWSVLIDLGRAGDARPRRDARGPVRRRGPRRASSSTASSPGPRRSAPTSGSCAKRSPRRTRRSAPSPRRT